ncbi:MAG: sigma-70 family RNA polymerase sigma factor [Candidatus Hydrogenedentes bacterium]|nr:sigma-70 family RNA polymerase sigma factor [Candidatus Hydrogenedentota bacterium]
MADDRTDRELMIAIRDVSECRALEELVRRWDSRLLGYLGKMLGDVFAARDLRQETYLRVWRSASTYNDTFAFSTWVTRIATNLARTQLARSRNDTGAVSAWARSGGEEAASPLAVRKIFANEQELFVRRVLEELSDADKELLLMRFQLELTYAQIGEITGCPDSTVKSRMNVLLRKLRHELEHQGIDSGNVLP